MKRLLISLLLIPVLAGWGCAPKPPSAPPEKTAAYTNIEYGFAFDYPVERMEVRDRPNNDQRRSPYLGIDTDFFVSVRDLSPKAMGQAINIVNFHAANDLGVADFIRALDQEPDVKIISEESVTMGEIPMTKVVSTTQAGIDKHHYLFSSKNSLVIVSISLTEHGNFEPVLQTFRGITE
jgi:hypothetical protein